MNAERNSAMRNSDRGYVHSVEKAGQVLDIIARAGSGMSVSELARQLSSSNSTAHRLLAGLCRTGLVEQDAETQRYWLGLHLLRLARAKLDSMDVRSEAIVVLEDLRRISGETVSLFVPIPGGALCVHQLQSGHRVRVVSHVGHTFPRDRGAVGLAIGGEHRDAIEVEMSTGEVDEGTRALAAPVLDYIGRVRGALTIAMPEQRWNPERYAEWAGSLRRAAFEVSRRLGWSGPDPETAPPPMPADEGR